jgi:hypothetical protein
VKGSRIKDLDEEMGVLRNGRARIKRFGKEMGVLWSR